MICLTEPILTLTRTPLPPQAFFTLLTQDMSFGKMDYDLLDLTDDEDRTALHIACLHNAVDCVEYLLNYYKG